jgi:signal peptide peptidase SppA
MPIPTPRRDEDRQKFIARCMGNPTMKREFPENTQRAAVCFRQWRQKTRAETLSTWTPLIGLWAVLPEWLTAHYPQITALMDEQRLHALPETDLDSRAFTPADLIQRTAENLAIIRVHGPMVKRAGFFEQLFGFTGSDGVREAIDMAASSPDITGILLSVESPGGHVAGVHELSEAVRRATAVKPVAVHMEDLGASAAYWASAHATRITASPITEIGSIGTMAVIADTSQLAAAEGIKIHVVSTGTYKGLGVPGTPIESAHLEEIQRRVNGVNQFFLRAVQAGRRLTPEQRTLATDGRVFLAAEAKSLGLIDDVRSMSAALRDLARLAATGRAGDTRSAIAARRTALEDISDADIGNRIEEPHHLSE